MTPARATHQPGLLPTSAPEPDTPAACERMDRWLAGAMTCRGRPARPPARSARSVLEETTPALCCLWESSLREKWRAGAMTTTARPARPTCFSSRSAPESGTPAGCDPNSEWTGHGPILEEDIAFTNLALDEL